MDQPDAVALFRGKQRNNCAQAVLRAYADVAGVGPCCIERFSQFGSGRAPEGQCGALFAAKAMLHDPAARRAVEDSFLRAAGSTACREIRREGRITCKQCVQTAAGEVYAQVRKGRPLGVPAECGE